MPYTHTQHTSRTIKYTLADTTFIFLVKFYRNPNDWEVDEVDGWIQGSNDINGEECEISLSEDDLRSMYNKHLGTHKSLYDIAIATAREEL